MLSTSCRFLAVVGALVFFTPAAKADLIIFPANDGFEVPDQGSGFTYRPTGASWTFSGDAGIAANGSGFNVSGATNGNHDSTASTAGQAAFLQGADGNFGSMSQTIGGFIDGSVSVTFSIEQRPGAGDNPIDVQLDGVDLGTYLAQSSGTFNTITTPFIPATAGSHTLSFFGTIAGPDATQFIDNVSLDNLAPVPEPTSLALLGVTATAAGFVSWRRRRQGAVPTTTEPLVA